MSPVFLAVVGMIVVIKVRAVVVIVSSGNKRSGGKYL